MNSTISQRLATVADLMKEALPLGADENMLALAETKLGLRLPKELREWLAFCNGSCNLLPAGYYGVCKAPDDSDIDAIDVMIEQIPEFKELAWFPIADDGCGGYWVMPLLGDRRPILFVDHEEGYDQARYVAASDLDHFLEMILERQILHRRDFDWSDRWPGDEEFVRARDPNIGEYNGVYPMWEADRRRRESHG